MIPTIGQFELLMSDYLFKKDVWIPGIGGFEVL
jgi:hypothetical protein